MIKYCIFDLDGTLLNTITSITYYLNRTLEAHGISEITEEECKIFIGDGARKLVYRALESKGIRDSYICDRVLRDYNNAYHSDPFYLTSVYPGIPELIDRLKESGITIGVLSNKPENTARAVVEHFFGDNFSFVRGGREGIPLKPSPVSTFQMLDEMGGMPSELAFIGDTGVDIDTGKAVGAQLTVGVLWGFRTTAELRSHGADVIADSIEDIFLAVRGK